jgi:TnpA family transposase
MKHITEYSDKEFMALVKELNRQETYLEKVKLFYDKTGRSRGYKRVIKDKEYTFSVKPKNEE